MLDNEHRKNVFFKKHKWNRVDQCLATGLLKRKVDLPANSVSVQKSAKKRSQGASRNVVASDATPCANFNDKTKYCPFNPCKNPHKCSIEGCYQNHPAYKHPSSNDRFRKLTDTSGGTG